MARNNETKRRVYECPECGGKARRIPANKSYEHFPVLLCTECPYLEVQYPEE